MDKSSEDKNTFVAMTHRDVMTCESTVEISLWVIKGTARVGDLCFISADNSIIETQILAIRTNKGYVLEARDNTETLITFSCLPVNVKIPCKSLISTKGYSSQEYANLPFEMYVEGTFDADRNIWIVGRIMRGTIKTGDKIAITIDSGSCSALVISIEQFKTFHESLSFGEDCGLLLSEVSKENKSQIMEGSKVTGIDK